MKDTESSSPTVVSLPARPSVAPIQLGNIWYAASTLVQTVAHAQRGVGDAPYVLMLSVEGNVHALLPSDPGYAAGIGADNFICTLDEATPIDQLAASLRAAVIRLGAQESA